MSLQATSKTPSLWRRFKRYVIEKPSVASLVRTTLDDEERNLHRQEEIAAHANAILEYYKKRVEDLRAKASEFQK